MIRWGPEINSYLAFILYGIIGKLQEADSVMRQHSNEIRSVAARLRAFHPPEIKRIYRGLLIEPSNMGPGNIISRDPNAQFVSFSEDKDVACWFADRESQISRFVAKVQRPDVEGWLIDYVPQPEDILFYWRWGLNFPFQNRMIDLNFFASQHPDPVISSQDYRIVLNKQKEYIIRPLDEEFTATGHADAGCPPTADLDRRLWGGPDDPPGVVFIPFNRNNPLNECYSCGTFF